MAGTLISLYHQVRVLTLIPLPEQEILLLLRSEVLNVQSYSEIGLLYINDIAI